MTITVSISDFRDNISDYLEKISRGDIVIIRDEKKNKEIAEVIGRKNFDPVAYRAMLKRVAGTFTAKSHPEWATRAKVEKWLRKTRMRDERKFNVRP